MENILIDIICAIIPECLYYYLYVIVVFGLKEKRKLLFICTTILYIICIIVPNYNVIFYTVFLILMYALLRVLYKDKIQITDFFVIFMSILYMTIAYTLSYTISKGQYSNYYLAMLISKLLLFMPFIFYKKMNTVYKKYKVLWDKSKENEKRSIKSITLRNISLISLFITLFSIYSVIVGIIYSFN